MRKPAPRPSRRAVPLTHLLRIPGLPDAEQPCYPSGPDADGDCYPADADANDSPCYPPSPSPSPGAGFPRRHR